MNEKTEIERKFIGAIAPEIQEQLEAIERESKEINTEREPDDMHICTTCNGTGLVTNNFITTMCPCQLFKI